MNRLVLKSTILSVFIRKLGGKLCGGLKNLWNKYQRRLRLQLWTFFILIRWNS